MGRKFSELEQDEKRIIENELESKSQQIGMDAFESYGSHEVSSLKELVGLCSNCKMLNYCKTEFGNVFAKCNEFEIRLTGQNRITECNMHSPKNVLTLTEMYSIAYLIDPSEEKVEGFISTNKRFMKKK